MSASTKTVIDNEAVAAHYDRLDYFYREIWGEHLHHGLWLTGRETRQQATRQLIETAAEPLAIKPGSLLCDVGCGYGATARLLQGQYGARVIGVTNSRVQFEAARNQADGAGHPGILHRDWLHNGLDSESFDGVLSIECLSHVPDQAAFFREIHRVLKPGGRAVILDWHAGEQLRDWEIRHLLEPICRDGSLAGLGKCEEHLESINGAGLRLVSHEDLTDQVRRTWNVLARRIAIHGLTRPNAWRFFASHPVTGWHYAMTIPRLLIAYRTDALRYGMFVVEKP